MVPCHVNIAPYFYPRLTIAVPHVYQCFGIYSLNQIVHKHSLPQFYLLSTFAAIQIITTA